MEILQGVSHVLVYGVSFLFIGLYIRYRIGKRKFNRRGIGGLQHYNSYEKAVATTLFEKLFNLIALVFILMGIFLLFTLWLDHHKWAKEAAEPPAIHFNNTKIK